MSKLDTLEPEIRPMVAELLLKAYAATGYEWVVTSGRRTMEQQRSLYAHGRTATGPIVTKAPPGSSAHNYGLAADLAPMKDGKIWWDAPRSVWDGMGAEAVKLGLMWGGNFKSILDLPHVEHPSWKEKQALWKAGKLTVL